MEDGFKYRRDKGVSSPPKLIAMDGVPTPMFMELDLQEYVIAITHIFTHRRVGSNRVKFLRKIQNHWIKRRFLYAFRKAFVRNMVFRLHAKTSQCTSAKESSIRKRSIDKCITLLVE